MATTVLLESYVDKIVCVITCEGKNLVGVLRGYDQTINIILEESHERVYSSNAAVQEQVLGLQLIRGDNVALIGEVEEAADLKIDLKAARGESIKPVVH